MLSLLLLPALLSVAYGASVSQTEFNAAAKNNGFKVPSAEVYNNFNTGIKDFSKEEAAMFLAQLMHESGGFRYVEEINCKKTKCPNDYKDKVGLPGKYYYGRGYIQLTWGANYKAASQALGMGDKLLQNPDLVASDKKIAMLVSVWYWNKRVKPLLRKHPNQFGYTTIGINGAECKKFPQRAKNRWNNYLKVAAALNIKNKALESGCYN